MDKVDDALFDLADKGENNQIQSLYFDAMREVRLRRPAIEAEFRIKLSEHFNERVRSDPVGRSAGPAAADEPQEERLILVEDDDLEEALAVTNMSAKMRSACKEELFLLDRRLGFLLGDEDLAGDANPIGPEVVCTAFKDACHALGAGIEVKLLILKLFDRFIVAEMAPLYRAINDHLVQREVLPGLRPSVHVKRNPAAPAGPAVGPGAPTGGDPETGDGGVAPQPGAGHAGGSAYPPGGGYAGGSPYPPPPAGPGGVPGTTGYAPATGYPGPSGGGFASAGGAGGGGYGGAPAGSGLLLDALQSLMRSGTFAVPAPAGGAPGDGSGMAVAGAPAAAAVIASLTDLQHSAAVPEGDPPGEAAGFDLRSLKAGGLAALGTGSAGSDELDLRDEMLIDIVAMMFDYILEDADLAPEMKALIGRLQIPLLKVAMLDRTLFSRRFHPARKLLNTLAEAAIGWEEGEAGDALYQTVDALVHRVLDEFDDDVSLFAELLEAFQQYMAEEERERTRRVTEAAESLERKARLEVAKAAVKTEIRRVLDGVRVPPIVKLFITRYWGGSLVVIHVKQGQESGAWASAVETMESLVWSVTPKRDPTDRRHLIAALPALLKRVNDGIKRVSMPAQERDQLVAALASCHAAIVRGDDDAANEIGEAELAPHEAAESGSGADRPPADEAAEAPSGDTGQGLGASAGGNATPGWIDGEADPGGPQDAPEEAASAANPFGPFEYAEAAILARSISRANRAIHDAARADPRLNGMGTTVVATLLRDDRIHYAHVGDSRLYRLRGGVLSQLTRDHSLAQELVDKGYYTPEEAATQVNKNLVTRGLGVEATVTPDVADDACAPGDLYLLCSDGLSDMVDAQQIQSIVKRYHDDVEHLAQVLVKAANDAGGRDNISVIVVRIQKAFPARRHWYSSKSLRGKVQFAARTDVGRRREHNEDSIAVDAETGALVLADGMGGLAAGEVASAMAVRTLMEDLAADDPAVPAAEASGETAGADNPNDIDLFAIEVPPATAAKPAAPRAKDAVTERMLDLLDTVEMDVESITIDAVPVTVEAPAAQEPPAVEAVDFDMLAFTRGSGDGDAADGDEFDAAAAAIGVGEWIELENEEGRKVRGRLGWINAATGVYLFTDRRGNKLAERTRHGLAVELRRGTARVLENVPLYDRAVTSLLDRLRAADEPSGIRSAAG